MDFTQQFNWKLAGQTQEQKGTIILKDKDKFRVATDDQVIVSDGTTLWTYSRIHNQVIIDNLQNSEDVILPREIFLKFSQKYNPQLLGEARVLESDCYHLRLNAKTEDVFIREIKIWVDKKSWITIKIEQKDINENLTTYTLENIIINPSIPDHKFTYKIPQDAEVINMR